MANNYQVIARKWRPQAFAEVVGQEHITRTLQNSIEAGRVGHAYLFIGSRGIGKTTTARILAKALNCLKSNGPTSDPCGACENCTAIAQGRHMDVIEIDGASNNKVEDVRDIREQIRLSPSSARYKIYIIDEVHQLSIQAFNALLKTLEEPPEHAIFILATTEAHKVPATIVSRCQRFDFRRVGQENLVQLLRHIVENEGIAYEEAALYAIARAADGGVRDSESILDQLISYCGDKITFSDVFDVLGLVDWHVLHNLCDAMVARNIGTQLKIVDDVVVHGKDLGQFVHEILGYFRNMLVCKTADAKQLLALPDEELQAIASRAEKFGFVHLIKLVEQFAELTNGFDSQVAQRVALETLLIRLSKVGVDLSVETVLEKLLLLEQGGNTGSDPRPASVGAAAAAPVLAPPPVDVDVEPPSTSVKRARVTSENLARFWVRFNAHVQREHSVLSVWLGQGRADRLDGDCLVVRFDGSHRQAREYVEQRDQQQFLVGELQRLTTNLTSIRTEADEAPVSTSGNNSAAPAPLGGHVTPEEAQAALDDPQIAQIVDVFKGRIVDVKHDRTP